MESLGKYRIQQYTKQLPLTTPDHEKNRYNTLTMSELAEATTNHHQRDFTGQRNHSIRNRDTDQDEEIT